MRTDKLTTKFQMALAEKPDTRARARADCNRERLFTENTFRMEMFPIVRSNS